MPDRPRFFDDLAGVAGGAFSAVSGLREEIHAMIRSRTDEILSSLDLVRREELDVVREMAAEARMAQAAAETRLAAIEKRLETFDHPSTPDTHDGPQG